MMRFIVKCVVAVYYIEGTLYTIFHDIAIGVQDGKNGTEVFEATFPLN